MWLLNEAIQRKLLMEADLILSKAFKIAQGIETAAGFCEGKKNAGGPLAYLIGKLEDSQESRVEKVIKGPPRQSFGNGSMGRNKKIVCFRCGKPGHYS